MAQSANKPFEKRARNDSTMAPRQKLQHLIGNQNGRATRMKPKSGTMDLNDDDHGNDHQEDPVSLADIFLNFRASCLNRANDIRDFAAARDNLKLEAADQSEMSRMTEILNEQFEFLNDAWRTLLYYVQRYSIEVDKDEAFQDVKKAKEHTTKVVEMAFNISEQFTKTCIEVNQVAYVAVEENMEDLALAEELVPQHNDMRIMKASDTGEARRFTNHTDDMDNKEDREEGEVCQDLVFDDIVQCNLSILGIIETIIAERDDMNPFRRRIEELQRLNATLRERENNTKTTREESPDGGEDPNLLIILDSLLTKLERVVDITSKGLMDWIERHSIKKAREVAALPEGEWNSQGAITTQREDAMEGAFSCKIKPIGDGKVWQREITLRKNQEIREYLSQPGVAEEYRGASEERHPVEQKTTYTIIKNTGIEMYPSEKTEGTTEPIEKSIAEIEKKGERKITTMRCWTRLK